MSENGKLPDDPLIVTISPHGWRFEALPSQTLLRSAELAGYRLPSSCRNGTCRTCLCRMSSGSVRYEIEWPGLSFDEKAAGDILPCVAHPESDVDLVAPAALSIRDGS